MIVATPVYIAGLGLASCLGLNLSAALQQIAQPPLPVLRRVQSAEADIPYHAITYPADSWAERCAGLIRLVMAEAGALNPHAALYIASASLNVGAIEAGEPHAENIPDFLTEIAQILAWQGPVYWVNTACTSSLTALQLAQTALAAGACDEAVVLGFELENRLSLAGFAAMQLLSTTASRPFAADRDGLVLGEAVAAIRLSTQPTRWRLAGGAQVIDSSQASGASVAAYQAMLAKSLASAQLSLADIDLIKVQAAGSVANDAVEADALHEFFAELPALLSLKPLLGHALGAAGAAEIALLLALLDAQQWPAVEKGGVLAQQAPARCRFILACILGFGGSHSSVVIENIY